MPTLRETELTPNESDERDASLIVASFPKNLREMVCVGFDEWQGESRAFVRVFARAVEGDDLVPTRAGVTLPVNKLSDLLDAIDRLGSVVTNERVVARIPKSESKEVWVGCNVFKKMPLIYIRTYARSDASSPEWFPTKQGISLRVEQYPALAEAVERLGNRANDWAGDPKPEGDHEAP